MCKFNAQCDRHRRTRTTSPRPVDAPAPSDGCPFPPGLGDVCLAKGEYLYTQGAAVRGGFSLTSGLVAVERVDENGALVILKVLRPGAFFPCADLFDDAIHGSSARALTNVTACFIPSQRLTAVLKDNLQVGMALLKRGCEEARENEEIIFRLCAGDLGDRVLALIEGLAGDACRPQPDGGRTLTLPINWCDLAAMVGTSPEVMSRLLRKLADAGRLQFTGRTITLPPRPRQAERACG